MPKQRTRCVYCGHFTMRRPVPGSLLPVTCPAHSDLPALDPYYSEQTRSPSVSAIGGTEAR